MISDAIIRTITRWLPTLDEARLREVEDFVLAKAIEQQDSVPADTVAPHDGERTHGGNCQGGGTVDAPAIDPLAPLRSREACAEAPEVDRGHAGSTPAPDTAPAHPSNGSHRVGGGCSCEDDPRTCVRHPYVFEGPNGTPRPRREFSPNKRLTATLADRIDPHVTAALRELRDATPDLNSAEMWSAEMVDERFDDSESCSMCRSPVQGGCWMGFYEPTTEVIDRVRWEWRPPQAVKAVCKMVFALGEWSRAVERKDRRAA